MEGKPGYPEAVCVGQEGTGCTGHKAWEKEGGPAALSLKMCPQDAMLYIAEKYSLQIKCLQCGIMPNSQRQRGALDPPRPLAQSLLCKEQVYKRLLIMSFTHVVQNHLGFVLDFCPL